ncbi:MAG: hypothetical protein M1481_06400 [Candidatus Thermoplasmatota archaeon]|jgi:hypothetical protein|nr:hypothetical protein [Candidatus Thermoplasmatota archaeon]MCL5962789.1 hypothetical protein [Candidatus Thermoplasmatota archaeon]
MDNKNRDIIKTNKINKKKIKVVVKKPFISTNKFNLTSALVFFFSVIIVYIITADKPVALIVSIFVTAIFYIYLIKKQMKSVRVIVNGESDAFNKEISQLATLYIRNKIEKELFLLKYSDERRDIAEYVVMVINEVNTFL